MSKGRSKPKVGEEELFKYYWNLHVSKMEDLVRNDAGSAIVSRMFDAKISTAQAMLKRMDLMAKCQIWGESNEYFTTLNKLRDEAVANRLSNPDVFKDYNKFRQFMNAFYKEQVAKGYTSEDMMKRITRAFEPPTNNVGPATMTPHKDNEGEDAEDNGDDTPIKKSVKPKFKKTVGSLIVHCGNARDHYNLGDPINIMRDGRMVNAKITSIVDESFMHVNSGYYSRYAIHATDYKKEVYEVSHIENLPCEVFYNYKTEVTPCV